ncbi:Semaphorin-4G [Sciurus carolinensis]|uniref:Semaphorin-4G n=1 Tax=Sciurus carolinensis TaxID=30640 RepID=A0AA41NHN5_SCICA|nr:Semaphorin-4G [Sciurus carolinensis]
MRVMMGRSLRDWRAAASRSSLGRVPQPHHPPPTTLVALPSRLRRMNGNSYVLLRQSNNGVPAGPCSFAEELSRILEKRKHTQLVEQLDESSV